MRPSDTDNDATPIRVLVVDDSAFMRKTLSAMLERDPRLRVVGTARNGMEAIEKAAALKPDVVTMDIEMPGMNGLEALGRIMATARLPVVMVSSLTEDGAKATLDALELGAVDYVFKPLSAIVSQRLDIQPELVAKVIAAATAKGKVKRAGRGTGFGVTPLASSAPRSATVGSRLPAGADTATRGGKVVAIGCSTGGPQALTEILSGLPEDFPAAVVIVQHMPKFFTKPFAERMNQLCRLEVREASDGDLVQPGVVLIAPGGRQLRVARRSALDVHVSLSRDSEGLLHAPSVDVTMQSVASVYGERGIGVILTGMGHDGLEGMRAIKGAKGRTLAQDEASCVVYGMPKAVIEAGCADKVVSLSHMAGELVNVV